jgi:2-iminobutanoate/2-iminopropanoate deaminase
MKRISATDAPKPVAAYSPGIEAGGIVYTAGQVGIELASGKLADGVEAQARLAFAHVGAIVRAAGLEVRDIAKITIFMTDLSRFAAVNAIFEQFVGEHRPARSTVGVASLPLGALIEVEAIAVRA